MKPIRRKTSAKKELILRDLDTQVISKAESISTVSKDFEQKVFREPIYFSVGEHQVSLEAKGDREDPDLFLKCDCPYWRFQGSEYHAYENNYLFGTPIGSLEKPVKRDPQGTHKICKHVYAVLRDFFGA